jgi:Fe-S-cluster containining protein
MSGGDGVEKHSLRSGVPCMNHKCVKCCLETRMPLSRFDMKKILELGYLLEDFTVKRGKEWRLRNRFRRCTFLSEDECKIYSHRPEGCRIYPLVYDEDAGRAVMHRLCFYRHEFEVRKDNVTILMKQLERLEST